jgi:hypothetical protein
MSTAPVDSPKYREGKSRPEQREANIRQATSFGRRSHIGAWGAASKTLPNGALYGKKNCMHLVYNGLLCIHVVDEYHVSSPHDPTVGRSGYLSWSTWAASVMGQPSGQRKDYRRWIILLYTWQQTVVELE